MVPDTRIEFFLDVHYIRGVFILVEATYTVQTVCSSVKKSHVRPTFGLPTPSKDKK